MPWWTRGRSCARCTARAACSRHLLAGTACRPLKLTHCDPETTLRTTQECGKSKIYYPPQDNLPVLSEAQSADLKASEAARARRFESLEHVGGAQPRMGLPARRRSCRRPRLPWPSARRSSSACRPSSRASPAVFPSRSSRKRWSATKRRCGSCARHRLTGCRAQLHRGSLYRIPTLECTHRAHVRLPLPAMWHAGRGNVGQAEGPADGRAARDARGASQGGAAVRGSARALAQAEVRI